MIEKEAAAEAFSEVIFQRNQANGVQLDPGLRPVHSGVCVCERRRGGWERERDVWSRAAIPVTPARNICFCPHIMRFTLRPYALNLIVCAHERAQTIKLKGRKQSSLGLDCLPHVDRPMGNLDNLEVGVRGCRS